MTFPATDGITDRLQALFAYDASSPLIFSSGLFLFLFAGFLLVYSAFRCAPMARIVYVIAFSLYFYYKSSGIYFLLLVFAAASDFLIARGIYRARFRWTKRWLVVLSVAVNLGMLGYFKYTNFLIDISNQLFGQGFLQFQNIFLPVGISFFVFQSMSYTIDIYRGQLKPLSNWLDYLFYLSFFPQLVAGPIVRARDFIPQIRQNPVVVTREMFGTGVFLILTGLFKKAIISDYISLNFVDRIFDEPLLYSGFECLMGIYGYALQIYCDFSGYSDMAIGIALLLGFRFPKNFDAPYKSATITEFWRRWHISLSTWFREYLYIPLGGNRCSKGRWVLNLFLVWAATGIWHGASWNFVLWGLYFWVLLLVEKFVLLRWLKRAPGAVGHLYTLFFVLVSWTIFAIEDFGQLGEYLKVMFGLGGVPLIDGAFKYYAANYLPVLCISALAATPLGAAVYRRLNVRTAHILGAVLILAGLLLCTAYLVDGTYNPFLYFRF